MIDEQLEVEDKEEKALRERIEREELEEQELSRKLAKFVSLQYDERQSRLISVTSLTSSRKEEESEECKSSTYSLESNTKQPADVSSSESTPPFAPPKVISLISPIRRKKVGRRKTVIA